jgi:hypothetical protein
MIEDQEREYSDITVLSLRQNDTEQQTTFYITLHDSTRTATGDCPSLAESLPNTQAIIAPNHRPYWTQ